jgi:hypothetical protein
MSVDTKITECYSWCGAAMDPLLLSTTSEIPADIHAMIKKVIDEIIRSGRC